jgi:acylphosphatase
MKKCVKVIFDVPNAQEVLETFIAQNAINCKIEGIGQKIKDDTVQLYICGQEYEVDEFIDALYLGKPGVEIKNIVIETSLTDRSYRSVFRIVE